MSSTTELCTAPIDSRQRRIEAVVREYQQPLLRYTARLLNNRTLAQDVVQNVFIKLFRQWQPRQEADESLKPWLYRVAHNEAVDMIRHEERRRSLHDRSAAEAELTHPPPADPHPDERRSLVLECLDQLDPAERQIVLLRLQQGLSYEEIAAVVGRPRGTVGALLHTAVKKLSRHVRRKEGL